MGLILGAAMVWHPDIAIKELADDGTWTTVRSTATTIPFIKDNHFDYAWLLSWLLEDAAQYVWIVFIPLVILIVTAVSNGAILTVGIVGLATGCCSMLGLYIVLF